jgi:hypothetical protein
MDSGARAAFAGSTEKVIARATAKKRCTEFIVTF